MMRDVELVVNQAGRRRVLREKRKNVHAFVRGQMQRSAKTGLAFRDAVPIRYNPYEAATFMTPTYGPGRPVHRARRVFLYIDRDGRPRMYAEGAE
jgi:hypothetical protein